MKANFSYVWDTVKYQISIGNYKIGIRGDSHQDGFRWGNEKISNFEVEERIKKILDKLNHKVYKAERSYVWYFLAKAAGLEDDSFTPKDIAEFVGAISAEMGTVEFSNIVEKLKAYKKPNSEKKSKFYWEGDVFCGEFGGQKFKLYKEASGDYGNGWAFGGQLYLTKEEVEKEIVKYPKLINHHPTSPYFWIQFFCDRNTRINTGELQNSELWDRLFNDSSLSKGYLNAFCENLQTEKLKDILDILAMKEWDSFPEVVKIREKIWEGMCWEKDGIATITLGGKCLSFDKFDKKELKPNAELDLERTLKSSKIWSKWEWEWNSTDQKSFVAISTNQKSFVAIVAALHTSVFLNGGKLTQSFWKAFKEKWEVGVADGNLWAKALTNYMSLTHPQSFFKFLSSTLWKDVEEIGEIKDWVKEWVGVEVKNSDKYECYINGLTWTEPTDLTQNTIKDRIKQNETIEEWVDYIWLRYHPNIRNNVSTYEWGLGGNESFWSNFSKDFNGPYAQEFSKYFKTTSPEVFYKYMKLDFWDNFEETIAIRNWVCGWLADEKNGTHQKISAKDKVEDFPFVWKNGKLDSFTWRGALLKITRLLNGYRFGGKVFKDGEEEILKKEIRETLDQIDWITTPDNYRFAFIKLANFHILGSTQVVRFFCTSNDQWWSDFYNFCPGDRDWTKSFYDHCKGMSKFAFLTLLNSNVWDGMNELEPIRNWVREKIRIENSDNGEAAAQPTKEMEEEKILQDSFHSAVGRVFQNKMSKILSLVGKAVGEDVATETVKELVELKAEPNARS